MVTLPLPNQCTLQRPQAVWTGKPIRTHQPYLNALYLNYLNYIDFNSLIFGIKFQTLIQPKSPKLMWTLFCLNPIFPWTGKLVQDSVLQSATFNWWKLVKPSRNFPYIKVWMGKKSLKSKCQLSKLGIANIWLISLKYVVEPKRSVDKIGEYMD